MPEPAARRKRGVTLGLVGLSFFLCQPLGLALAWWHPSFRENGRRDKLLVAAVFVYLVVLGLSIALSVSEPER